MSCREFRLSPSSTTPITIALTGVRNVVSNALVAPARAMSLEVCGALGVLIATAARYGAMFSGCTDEQVETLEHTCRGLERAAEAASLAPLLEAVSHYLNESDIQRLRSLYTV